MTPTNAPSKDHLGKALAVAKKSTASIGKFTDTLPKEKPSKFTGKKRKVCRFTAKIIMFVSLFKLYLFYNYKLEYNYTLGFKIHVLPKTQ